MLKIGELSQQTGVSSEAVRYYERIGLLPEPARADNGYRLYTDADVERLRFVHSARALDFSLDDIEEILAFRERGEPPCRYVMGLMQTQIDEITARIRELEKLRWELKRLYEAGQQMPEDIQMKACVCHLIEATTTSESKDKE